MFGNDLSYNLPLLLTMEVRFHLLEPIQYILFGQNTDLPELLSCTGIHYIVRRVDCGLRGQIAVRPVSANRQISFIGKPSNSLPKARPLPSSNLADHISLVRSDQVDFIDKPSNYLSLPSRLNVILAILKGSSNQGSRI